MANYTIKVYDVLNAMNDNKIAGSNINSVIDNHYQDIFDDSWDTYDPAYKPTLCKKILKHYLMYEIGSETFALWKFHLNMSLAEIMPKYNAMYKNIDKAYGDFFADVNYTETFDKSSNSSSEENGTENVTNTATKNGTETTTETTGLTTVGTVEESGSNSSNSTSTQVGESSQTQNTNGSATTNGTQESTSSGNANSDQWQASNDTPQGGLDGLIDNKYLSSAVHNYGDSENNATSSTSTTGESTNNATLEDKTSSKITNDATTTGTEKNETATNQTETGSKETNGTTSETDNESADKTTAKTGNSENTENYVKNVIGKMGSENNAKLFNDICQELVNIDLLIINELKDNFILLWE